MRPITLFLPAGSIISPDDDGYLPQLGDALGRRGVELSRVPIADTAMAADGLEHIPAEGGALIEAPLLGCFDTFAPALADRRVTALVHHLPAEWTTAAASRPGLQALAACARVIATSAAVAQRLASHCGVTPERLAVVPPGIGDRPRSLGSGSARCRILSVGALVPCNGHDILLRALARLFDLEWELTIIGDPNRDPVHARMLVAEAEALGVVEHVQLREPGDAKAFDALWQGSDVFALAATWQGYAMAVAEALRRGLPVAATVDQDLVPPEAGVVCEPGDASSLSKALRRLIFDPDLRRLLADAAWTAGRALPDWSEQADAVLVALG